MSKYYIGVDLHKTVAQVCVLDETGEVAREWRASLETNEEGTALLDDLSGYQKPSRIAVEAIGCNRWFVNGAQAMNLDVIVVHPAALKLKESGRKTDRRDAAEIARRLYLGDLDRHGRSYYPTETEYGARKLLRMRHATKKALGRMTNQIRALLNAYLMRPPTKVLLTKASLAWLRKVELPTPELTFTLRVFLSQVRHTMRLLKRIKKQVEDLAREPKVAGLTEQLPFAGVLTTATIFYELGDVGRFRRTREVSSYAGIVPRVSQSGEGAAHHGRLDKRGNPELRWILSQWAVRLIARVPLVHAWAMQHRRRKPMNKIRTALARRLLIGVYHALRTGEAFSLARCLNVEVAA